jgi:hypothetical protein
MLTKIVRLPRALILAGSFLAGCGSTDDAFDDQPPSPADSGSAIDAAHDALSDSKLDATSDSSQPDAKPDSSALDSSTKPDADASVGDSHVENDADSSASDSHVDSDSSVPKDSSVADSHTDSGGPSDASSDGQTSQPTVQDLGIVDYSAGKKGPFARNPWDMTYFQGRLYIGQGNSDNDGSPDTNAGPVKISYLVPGTSGFQYEGASGVATLPEEQIDVIRAINTDLYIPGHDPELDWTIRTLYKRTSANTAWTQYKSTNAVETDSWGVHSYDVFGFDNSLFICGYAFGISTDGGQTWADAGPSSRCSAFMVINGKLYSPTFESLGVYEYDSGTKKFVDRADLSMAWAKLLPNIQITDPSKSSLKIVRPVSVGKSTIYLGGYSTSDHQTGTTDVYLAKSLEKNAIDVVRTTPSGERPWDLLVRGTTAYLLTSSKTGTGASEKFTASVWRSNADYSGWTKRFSVPDLGTFARSFEEVNQDFYLGLGTDDGNNGYTPADVSYTTGVKAESGRILRVVH